MTATTKADCRWLPIVNKHCVEPSIAWSLCLATMRHNQWCHNNWHQCIVRRTW